MEDQTYGGLTVDAYFDKVFYINLPDERARDESVRQGLARAAITNFERVEAVKYDVVPGKYEWRNFNRQEEKYMIGQLSCRASHLKCVQMAWERCYKRVLILEDDVVFLEDPNVILNLNQEILNDWDILYFGGLAEPFFRNQIVCAHAYAIRSTVFEDILHMAPASGMEIDNFYAKVLQHMSFNGNQSGKYNVRCMSPFNTIVQNKQFPSRIQ
jgi:GR25 family glycosyltransferase involved in LPS biosynthesis